MRKVGVIIKISDINLNNVSKNWYITTLVFETASKTGDKITIKTIKFYVNYQKIKANHITHFKQPAISYCKQVPAKGQGLQ